MVHGVRVVGDAGCKGVHKEKKVKGVKFLFTLQERRGAWCGEVRQHWRVGALSSCWIITALKGWGAVVQPLGSLSDVIFHLWL